MSYTVLARRYRSRDFDEVVGQDAIAQTLRASIEQDRVAHAYLFVGTRGVGKTSMARIFAKALNGGTPEVDEAIMAGRDTDVIEIDAASNSRVDETRELIANSVYRPLRGPYKVFIIDEVHMLSVQAFNALLKTLEEPPEHVKFILCTTETHKVPATIQSRCQRFDFKNIPHRQIAEHLARVINDEGLEAEPELIAAVARLGNGSMRDALSVLERLMAAGEKKLTLAQLESLLGLPDFHLLGRLIDAFASCDPATALEAADELVTRGVSPDQVLESLAERLRDLMVLSACGPGTALVNMSQGVLEAEHERARGFDPAGLVHMIALCDSVGRSMRSSAAPRAVFDALMVRLAQAHKIADATAVVLQSGGMSPAMAGASASGGSRGGGGKKG